MATGSCPVYGHAKVEYVVTEAATGKEVDRWTECPDQNTAVHLQKLHAYALRMAALPRPRAEG